MPVAPDDRAVELEPLDVGGESIARGEAGDQVIVATTCQLGDDVATLLDSVGVVTAAADHRIIAAEADYDVVAAVAGDHVGMVIANADEVIRAGQLEILDLVDQPAEVWLVSRYRFLRRRPRGRGGAEATGSR